MLLVKASGMISERDNSTVKIGEEDCELTTAPVSALL